MLQLAQQHTGRLLCGGSSFWLRLLPFLTEMYEEPPTEGGASATASTAPARGQAVRGL